MSPKPNRKAVLLPACSMAAIIWMLVSYALTASSVSYQSMDWFALLLSPFALLVGTLLLLRRPRLGYMVAALGAALPLPWIFLTESRRALNSWIALNASWNDPDTFRYMRYSQPRILSVGLLLMTLVWAVTRLLPLHWHLRNRAVNQRTWPAIAITLIFIVYWFGTFAFPYRQPVITDGVRPELSILHVEKDGITFHETRISLYRDGRYQLVRNDRQLFHYSFVETAHEGLLTDDLRAKLKAIEALPELKQTLDKAPRALRARHGEGWYTETGSFAITAFTTENATPPPADLRAFLRELEGAPTIGPSSQYEVRDVALGFSYDPKAGLGYSAQNQRCAHRPDGREDCY